MSVKVKKIEQTKDWVDKILIKVKATINEGAQLRIDSNLLPQKLQGENHIDEATINLSSFFGGRNSRYGILNLTDKRRPNPDPGRQKISQELREYLEKLIDRLTLLSQKSENSPIRIPLSAGDVWMFKGFIYAIEYNNQVRHSYEEEQLLVLESYDQERRKFEQLKRKYNSDAVEKESYRRECIPEDVRIAVWRRDDGKCARCEGREKLEYDHIVPVSNGGGNTARNIELLCESCNRKKHNNIQ